MPVILPFPRSYAADAVELRLPDLVTARSLPGDPVDGINDALDDCIASLGPPSRHGDRQLLARTRAATQLGYARLGMRHGHLGDDLHAYHNERHVIDIVTRIGQMARAAGAAALPLWQWCVLLLFAGCHDLRQRERSLFHAGVGANERASIDEALRILDASGFCRDADAAVFVALELAIAGSTFSAPSSARYYNAAEQAQAGGALALQLGPHLDQHRPGWRNNPLLVDARALALIAADLDTANVAAPFNEFTRSAQELCLEREMLAGRPLHAPHGGVPALSFLTDTQEHFFFRLHRFNSTLGLRTFEAGKRRNAPLLRSLCIGLRARVALQGPPANARDVLALYRETLGTLPAIPISNEMA